LATDNKITIYIVEDYLLIRKSLKHIIGKSDEFSVIGDFDTAEKFLETFKSNPSDVVIIDLGLPCMNGLKATQEIKSLSPDTKVIILTSHENTDEVLAALAVGANAFCLKEIESFLIHSIIRDVYNGVLWLHPQFGEVSNSLKGSNLVEYFSQSFEPEELEVLRYIIEGKTNAEIANIMSFNTNLAKAHVNSVLAKLLVNDRVQDTINTVRSKIVG